MHFTKVCCNLITIASSNEQFRVKIGLEIHARILSNAKLFSAAETSTLVNSSANSKASFFDAALPGTMPTLNRRCVESAILTGLALNCKINSLSYFERKHYFYPDMPLGYQITQQHKPIAVDGNYEYTIFDYKSSKMSLKSAKIKRIQLEHDSARTITMNDENNKKVELSLIDLNRCGLGLMEIVTEPNFSSSVETSSFVYELAALLKELKVCEVNVKDGGLRVDCNISVHKVDKDMNEADSARIELKNINNLSSIRKAIDYEIDRQIKLKLEGKEHELTLQTRGYDSLTETTYLLRIKDTFYDYRFMPEPNLLPLFVYTVHNKALIDEKTLLVDDMTNYNAYVGSILSEKADIDGISGINIDEIIERRRNCLLPKDICELLNKKFKIATEKAFLIVSNKLDQLIIEMIERNEDLNSLKPEDSSVYFNLLMNEYLRVLNLNENQAKVLTVDKLIEIVNLLKSKKINKNLKDILIDLLIRKENENKTVAQVCIENELTINRDRVAILNSINKTLDSKDNQKYVKEYHNKEKKKLKIFLKFTKLIQTDFNQKADTKILNDLLREGLDKRKP